MTIVGLLVLILVIGALVYLARMLPEPWKTPVMVVLVVGAIIYLLTHFLGNPRLF